ncbi:MAG: hypothetical protein DRH90_17610 [Deltaproteobacteria bacterium]|nr:MAG: hypothetical protein DRH90_17610 [Deltaproteobacteria bacterium]RLC14956.1 MAG: hypothetical protein DRI24_12155 [Deltaproteobacteria bacterium]
MGVGCRCCFFGFISSLPVLTCFFVTTKRELPPTHPGEILREDFMPDFDLSTSSMAKAFLSRFRLTMTARRKEPTLVHYRAACPLHRLLVVR